MQPTGESKLSSAEANPNLRDIYTNAFTDDTYNKDPGRGKRYRYALDFINKLRLKIVTDVGSGRGAFINGFSEEFDVLNLDVGYFLDGMKPFKQFDLRSKDSPRHRGGVVTCLDVLEHVPKADLHVAVRNLRSIADYAVISAANHSDVHQGVELHLTQEPIDFWTELIAKHFTILESQDHGNVYYFRCGP